MDKEPHELGWTPKLVLALKEGIAACLSMDQIAKKIGVTRNAVIGKCYRLGICLSREQIKQRRAARGNIDTATPHRTRRQTLADTHMRHAFDRATMLEAAIERDGLRDLPPDQSPHAVPLLQIRERQCRWPLNDVGPGFLFCGDKVFDGSYCARHSRLAHKAGTGSRISERRSKGFADHVAVLDRSTPYRPEESLGAPPQ